MSAAETTNPRVAREAMKILRSVKRRDFSIEPAGYFNVLTPSKRFAPSHPPGEFHYLPGQSKETAFPQAHENPATPPQFELIPSPYRNDPLYLRLLRPVLLVLAAFALMYFLLWCLGGFPIPRYHFVQPPKCSPCTSNPK
jgi:hypothetical protein